jgi:serine/threonine protein kinase
MAEPSGITVGGALGPYRIEAVLGEGATGTVYRALRASDEEHVALKVLRRELSLNETYRRRFEHEARAAREVTHRHLVPIVDAGEAEGRYYLAFRFVEGRSLHEWIESDGPLARDDIVRLGAEVGGALDALHTHGLVHRDVKPSNVLMDAGGSSALTDFGLARGPAYTVLTRPGQVVGTLDYLAPELIRGSPATSATDIYALGCVVFECIAGTPPFAGRGLFEVGAAHLQEDPPDPGAGRGDIPAALSWAVARALSKNPEERPPTGTAFGHLLRASAR